MTSYMKIRPKSGLIRDPITRKRLAEGKEQLVPKINYWLRRLKEGDVEICSDASSPKKAPKKKPQPKKELMLEESDGD